MIAQTKSLNEITTEAIHILCKEIGLVNTIRFINQFTMGYGNYTQERDSLYNDLTFSDLVNKIRKMKTELRTSNNLKPESVT